VIDADANRRQVFVTDSRRLVYVSGAPGSGKTSLAVPLAAELALQRYNARVCHPVHVVTTLQMEAMAEYDRPVGVGALVTVDTTVPFDVKAIASAVRDRHDRMIGLR
jgi:Ni2+-binding GTPase involved in maturation of urease and hydrogenase